MEWLYTLVGIIIWDLLRTWLVVYLTAKKVKKDREEEKHDSD
ncbi:hypothetical protein LCGC14_1150890 [marine sediment metagenome]|uniref:Uncharacterized protein n=1 Tax=marine sediment metagenome TaxID=412755 RepID=A0A0F9M0G2_9ZZZZ